MTIRNSVETARASVSNIESYISKKWPGFFDEIATTLSKPLWRMGKNDMFAICDQDIDDINKVQFLAIQERAIQRILLSSKTLQRPGGAWDCIPPIDLANLCCDWKRSPVVLEFNSSLVEELQRSDIDPDVDLSEHLEHLPFSCFFISAEHLGFRLSNADGKLKHAVGFFLDYAWMPRSDQPHRVEKHFIITIIGSNGYTIPVVIPLRFSTIKDLSAYVVETYLQANGGKSKMIKVFVDEDLHTILSLLLYIASKEPDIVEKEIARRKDTNDLDRSSTFNNDQEPLDEPRTFLVGGKSGPLSRRIDTRTKTQAAAVR
ncbi:hypothetical protein C1866_01200 [Eggerthella lenta]|uniref:hypothetical protein n=1 Tax=Eggerthella lenta TaxID=84112 RepID=UPI000E18062B|nr:hypothetical protein [Eggerthella lenta]RDB99524.1 hypothetical protein C1866_01200 [Eggerthella lenta]